MPKVILQACIDSDEIIRALTYLSQEEILEFLLELDDTIGDWDFTRMARDYFAAEMRKVEHDD
jgi:hypothetical protein